MNLARLGIYGGTFNPIHTGHLIIAQEIYDRLSLDRIVFIPSGRPPHKNDAAVTAPEHRHAMVTLATNSDPRFEVSDLELRRPGLSYTIETLRELRRHYGPESRFFFVIGADSLVEIDTWRSPDEVFACATVVVVPRPGVDIDQAPLPWRERVTTVQSPMMAVSSTDIRHRVKSGRSIRYFVHPDVEHYIHKHRLYLDEKS